MLLRAAREYVGGALGLGNLRPLNPLLSFYISSADGP